MLGPERKSHILSKKKRNYCISRSGSCVNRICVCHTLIRFTRFRSFHEVVRQVTHSNHQSKIENYNRKEFLDDIAVSLGGYVVEKLIFDDLTTGSSNDLQVSTALARDMVTRYGMSDKIGPLALEEGDDRFWTGVEDKGYSEKVGSDIDAEVSRIMRQKLLKRQSLL